jgi:hypothetical protein
VKQASEGSAPQTSIVSRNQIPIDLLPAALHLSLSQLPGNTSYFHAINATQSTHVGNTCVANGRKSLFSVLNVRVYHMQVACHSNPTNVASLSVIAEPVWVGEHTTFRTEHAGFLHDGMAFKWRSPRKSAMLVDPLRETELEIFLRQRYAGIVGYGGSRPFLHHPWFEKLALVGRC